MFVAALLHYLFTAAFCWMLCEGVMLYLMLVVVFSELAKKWWIFLLLGWGESDSLKLNEQVLSCAYHNSQENLAPAL